MCRCTLVHESKWFYAPLVCTTDADELYKRAKHIERANVWQLKSIEPCLEMFERSINPPTSKDAQETVRTAQ